MKIHLALAALSLWAVSCSGSPASGHGPADPPSCKSGEATMPYQCSCDDGREAAGTLDACNGTVVAACDCGQPRACTTEQGCPGSQLCRDVDCGPCLCTPSTWLGVTKGEGDVKDMGSDGQGHVALLMTATPWLETLDADGALHAVPVASSLSWARWVRAAPNGTMVVLGASPSSAGFQFQRFDTLGKMVGSGSWSFPDGPAGLANVARLPGKGLALLASNAGKLAFLTLSDEDEITTVATLPKTSEDAPGCCSSIPTGFAVAPNGDYLLAGQLEGDQRVDGVWWATFDSKGQLEGAQSDKSYDLFDPSPRVAGSAVGNFSTWTWSFSDFIPRQSYVARLDAAQNRIWTVESTDESSYFLADLVALPDGVLAIGANGLEPQLVRYTPAGMHSDVQVPLPDPPLQAVAVHDYELVILTTPYGGKTFDLTRMQVPPMLGSSP